jgi:hypothetical protein
MQEKSFFIRGTPIIAHDSKLSEKIAFIQARMLFPKEKESRKRNTFLKFFGQNRSNILSTELHKIKREADRREVEGTVAGLLCIKQLILSKKWSSPPSIRFLHYAILRGFMHGWSEAGYPIKDARNIYSKFKQVRHLWAAGFFMLSEVSRMNQAWESKLDPSSGLWLMPKAFMGSVWCVREGLINLGLAHGKQDFWMPKNWREFADIPTLDSEIVPDGWEQEREHLESLWEAYTKDMAWKDS